MGAALPLAARFWRHVEKTGGCWNWTAARNRKGYGTFTMPGKMRHVPTLAHRVSWFLTHGKWPEPCALHRCDNPRCVRPDHLFEGTKADNNADMRAKGRASGNRGRLIVGPGGEALIMNAWSKRYSISPQAIRARLRLGWSFERAVCEPLNPEKQNRKSASARAVSP